MIVDKLADRAGLPRPPELYAHPELDPELVRHRHAGPVGHRRH